MSGYKPTFAFAKILMNVVSRARLMARILVTLNSMGLGGKIHCICHVSAMMLLFCMFNSTVFSWFYMYRFIEYVLWKQKSLRHLYWSNIKNINFNKIYKKNSKYTSYMNVQKKNKCVHSMIGICVYVTMSPVLGIAHTYLNHAFVIILESPCYSRFITLSHLRTSTSHLIYQCHSMYTVSKLAKLLYTINKDTVQNKHEHTYVLYSLFCSLFSFKNIVYLRQ